MPEAVPGQNKLCGVHGFSTDSKSCMLLDSRIFESHDIELRARTGNARAVSLASKPVRAWMPGPFRSVLPKAKPAPAAGGPARPKQASAKPVRAKPAGAKPAAKRQKNQ